MSETIEAVVDSVTPKKKFTLNPKVKLALTISLTAGATAFAILGGQSALSARDEDVEAKTIETIENLK